MPAIFDAADYRRHRLYNGPQIDPTRRAAKAGIPHYGPRPLLLRSFFNLNE